MEPSDLPSLQDVYISLDDAQKVQETRYILQFVWRDLTGSFDVVGPYYTSADGFNAKFTLACLFDAMLLFETYNFHVGAIVGDGASWNQALFKKLSGHNGKFGAEAVSASFTNPFTGWRTWCIVCPSHEVKNVCCACYTVRVHLHSIVVYFSVEKSCVCAVQFWSLENKALFQRGHSFWLEDHRKALGERSGEVTKGSDGDNSKNEVSIHIP